MGVTLGLTWREERTEKRFEEVFVPKRKGVTRDWRKLRNGEFNDL